MDFTQGGSPDENQQSQLVPVGSPADQDLHPAPLRQRLPAAVSQDQVGMELKGSRLEWMYNLKNRVNRVSSVAQVFPYWRNLNTSLAIISSVILVLAMFLMITGDASASVNELPLIYIQASQSWELIDKEFLLGVPFFTGAMLVILLNLSSSIYKFDRRLSFMINTGMIVFNLLGLFGFYQLSSLILLY
ncbi:MAG: hypothetical protein TR69_WS6001001144 [candidate division WS6 bacterium OLB20]|uniref:Uncharacterized protein n=1 Tax=candidate division WS6 bacterium OLB20 TaxID=1617426 RepID=A0A136LWW1_9BACT|nr:MAG: hypothetical protein TR69_WS6001001144 [candidate division WS6 bacterium OLB20]